MKMKMKCLTCMVAALIFVPMCFDVGSITTALASLSQDPASTTNKVTVDTLHTAETSTPTQSLSPNGNQPTPPITAAFFYPWFPKNWEEEGINPFTQYHPTLGFYNSTDDAIIDQQLVLAKFTGIQAMISSWWGQADMTDTALQHILARSERLGSPYQAMRWSINYEQEGYGDPTVGQIASDLRYLQEHFFSQPGWLWVDGKPVVFVYGNALDACGMVERWIQARQQSGVSVYLVLKVFEGYTSCLSQPDSWYQYSPALGYDSQVPYSVMVSPGFYKAGESLPKLARNITRFTHDIQAMRASGATWQLIETWNEWGEGTSVEPAVEFGTAYLDALAATAPTPIPPVSLSITRVKLVPDHQQYLEWDIASTGTDDAWAAPTSGIYAPLDRFPGYVKVGSTGARYAYDATTSSWTTVYPYNGYGWFEAKAGHSYRLFSGPVITSDAKWAAFNALLFYSGGFHQLYTSGLYATPLR